MTQTRVLLADDHTLIRAGLRMVIDSQPDLNVVGEAEDGRIAVALAEKLARPETVFAVTGAPSDLVRTEPVVARLREAGLNAVAFVGQDGFQSLARMLKLARVVVSVNTGVMHLAAIVGAPTVSINGPNRNGRWGPVGPRAIGVEAPGEGCGYLHLGFNFDGQATDCMERINVDMVADAAEKVQAL